GSDRRVQRQSSRRVFGFDGVHESLAASSRAPDPARIVPNGLICWQHPEMELFQRILQTAIEGGASDVHLKIGTPVVFRINRQLVAIEAPHPTAPWMENVIEHIVPKHAKKRLDEEREVDFSYFVPGVGRFRTN